MPTPGRSVHFLRRAGWLAPPVALLTAIAVTVLIGVIGFSVAIELGQSGVRGAVIGAFVGLLIGAALANSFRKPNQPPAIVIGERSVALPKRKNDPTTVEVPYREVLSVRRYGKDRKAVVVLRTARRMFIYPLSIIGEACYVELHRAVFAGLLAEPDATELIAGIRHRNRLGKVLADRRAPVTIALLAVCSVVFAIELNLDATSDFIQMLKLGGNSHALVVDGDWFRLITANFLHGMWLHFLMNMWALFILGEVLERIIGSTRFAVVYLVSGAMGAAASAFLSGALISVGASTALFGLLGAWGYLSLRFAKHVPSGFAVSTYRFWIVIAANLLLPVLIPFIDFWAHVGGAVAGGALGFVLYPTALPDFTKKAPLAVTGCVAALLVLHAAALALLVLSDRNERTYLEMVAASESISPVAANDQAWRIAISSTSSRDLLEGAEGLARVAAGRESEPRVRDAIRDTHATLLHRLERWDQAIVVELDLAQRRQEPIYWTQLGRFMRARFNARGAAYHQTPADSMRTRMSAEGLVATTSTHGASLFFMAPGRFDAGCGLLQVRIPPTRSATIANHRLSLAAGCGRVLVAVATSTSTALLVDEMPFTDEADDYP